MRPILPTTERRCASGIRIWAKLSKGGDNLSPPLALEFATLTIGLKVDEYKQVKALERENLRDHMTGIELILTML
jgi:hypothetical protein